MLRPSPGPNARCQERAGALSAASIHSASRIDATAAVRLPNALPPGGQSRQAPSRPRGDDLTCGRLEPAQVACVPGAGDLGPHQRRPPGGTVGRRRPEQSPAPTPRASAWGGPVRRARRVVLPSPDCVAPVRAGQHDPAARRGRRIRAAVQASDDRPGQQVDRVDAVALRGDPPSESGQSGNTHLGPRHGHPVGNEVASRVPVRNSASSRSAAWTRPEAMRSAASSCAMRWPVRCRSERADVACERAMPAAAVGATPTPRRRHIASNTATSCSGSGDVVRAGGRQVPAGTSGIALPPGHRRARTRASEPFVARTRQPDICAGHPGVGRPYPGTPPTPVNEIRGTVRTGDADAT